jgi:hypothetical protein
MKNKHTQSGRYPSTDRSHPTALKLQRTDSSAYSQSLYAQPPLPSSRDSSTLSEASLVSGRDWRMHEWVGTPSGNRTVMIGSVCGRLHKLQRSRVRIRSVCLSCASCYADSGMTGWAGPVCVTALFLLKYPGRVYREGEELLGRAAVVSPLRPFFLVSGLTVAEVGIIIEPPKRNGLMTPCLGGGTGICRREFCV